LLLVTWNCNSIRARMPRLLELLETHQPDVVCLQETKVAPGLFPHLELAMAGYAAIDHSSGTWNGVAVLVPVDVDVSGAVFGLEGQPRPDEARWLEVDVRGVRVVTAYVPNGRQPGHPRFAEKLAFLEAAGERAAAALAAGGPTVVAGDLNVAPTDDDVWNPRRTAGRTHVTPEERTRVTALLERGFYDAWLKAGEGGRYTWWSNAPAAVDRDQGMRIDLTLVSHDLGVRRCVVDRAFRQGPRPSDHAPLLTWLDL
jgi:exodeoxyribonuclease III